MSVAFRRSVTRHAVVISRMILPSATGVSRFHGPIEADEGGEHP